MNIKMICKNCMDYDHAKEECLIRYKISTYKTRTPMKRRPNQKGCKVFLFAP